jgi:hypothetical protein
MTPIPVTIFLHVGRPDASGTAQVEAILESGPRCKVLRCRVGASSPLDAQLGGALAALGALRRPADSLVGLVTDAPAVPRVVNDDWTPAAAAERARQLQAAARSCAAIVAVYRPQATALATAARSPIPAA